MQGGLAVGIPIPGNGSKVHADRPEGGADKFAELACSVCEQGLHLIEVGLPRLGGNMRIGQALGGEHTHIFTVFLCGTVHLIGYGILQLVPVQRGLAVSLSVPDDRLYYRQLHCRGNNIASEAVSRVVFHCDHIVIIGLAVFCGCVSVFRRAHGCYLDKFTVCTFASIHCIAIRAIDCSPGQQRPTALIAAHRKLCNLWVDSSSGNNIASETGSRVVFHCDHIVIIGLAVLCGCVSVFRRAHGCYLDKFTVCTFASIHCIAIRAIGCSPGQQRPAALIAAHRKLCNLRADSSNGNCFTEGRGRSILKDRSDLIGVGCARHCRGIAVAEIVCLIELGKVIAGVLRAVDLIMIHIG